MNNILDIYNDTTNEDIIEAWKGFKLSSQLPSPLKAYWISQPLPEDLAEKILLTGKCHVDHEGFDLNEIEQAYYANEGVSLTQDDTWYKDGDGDRYSTAIIQPWMTQLNTVDYDDIVSNDEQLILDHSHFVFRLPIYGEAAKQIRRYVPKRPELLRLLSAQFKCGLDFCVDLLTKDSVQPIVHIEWDYKSYVDMYNTASILTRQIQTGDWYTSVATIKQFNTNKLTKNIGAFDQADFRSMTIFNDKAYKLIPTLYGN